MARNFTILTRSAMRQLAPLQSLSEHGITFTRNKNGDGVFSVNIMVDGERIHRVIGRESDGTTRKQAESFIEESRSAARNDRLSLPKGRKRYRFVMRQRSTWNVRARRMAKICE